MKSAVFVKQEMTSWTRHAIEVEKNKTVVLKGIEFFFSLFFRFAGLPARFWTCFRDKKKRKHKTPNKTKPTKATNTLKTFGATFVSNCACVVSFCRKPNKKIKEKIKNLHACVRESVRLCVASPEMQGAPLCKQMSTFGFERPMRELMW